MRKLYLVILFILFAFEMWLEGKNNYMLSVYLTLGLGLPLVYMPTVFVYFLCMFPLAIFSRGRVSFFVSLAVSACVLIVVALVPGWKSNNLYIEDKNNLKVYRRTSANSTPPRAIEIRRSRQGGFNDFGFDFSNRICDFVCSHLLKSGQVDWVRMVFPTINKKSSFKGIPPTVLFRLAKGKQCGNVENGSVANFTCVIPSNDNVKSERLILEFESHPHQEKPVSLVIKSSKLRGWRKVTGYLNEHKKENISLLWQEQKIAVVESPTVFMIGTLGMSSEGSVLRYRNETINSIDYRKVFIAFGYQVPAKRILKKSQKVTHISRNGSATAQQTNNALSVLNLTQKAQFSRAQTVFINQWIMHSKFQGEWPAEQLEIARKIMYDSRIAKINSFRDINKLSKGFETLFKDALDIWENRQKDQHVALAAEFLNYFHIFPHKLLSANQEQIVRIIRAEKAGKLYISFAKASVLLGENPLTFLSQVRDEETKVYLLCLSIPSGQEKVIEALRAALFLSKAVWKPKLRKRLKAPDRFTRRILRSLILQEDSAFVDAFIQDFPEWKNPKVMRDMKNGFLSSSSTNILDQC